MILVIDNYDSFVFNLARYFNRLGHATRVERNDALTADEALALRPDAIVLSPGPCTPREAGVSLALVRASLGRVPLLGVCLGHQTLAAALGGQVVRAAEPCHGQASLVEHAGQGLFAGLPNPLRCGRYHSLVVDEATLPAELEVTARTADGLVMALAHRQAPAWGVQFHPESILTAHGYELLAAFLGRAGLAVPQPLPGLASEWRETRPAARPLPDRPVTF